MEADYDYYRREIAPYLPARVLDFHTHTWSSENWKEIPWTTDKNGTRYVVADEFYPPQQLLRDGRACFPDRSYEAVCFGYPAPAVDWEKDTAYVAAAAREHPGLWPLVLAGPDLGVSRERYEQALDEGGFYGFKVFLNWYGDDYGDRRVEQMFGPAELALANERRLVVMLHVPRSGRLADPVVQAGVRWLAGECPEARIVLAHCGRCYLPVEIKAAIGCLRGLENVWMDTAMVMDPVTLQIALGEIGPARLLFATDFPVAAMRGRRVRVMDHWVDVVLPGYPRSAYRAPGEGIHAGFMTWEIVLAIRWAAELAGISEAERDGIFYDNGMGLLNTCT
ncbi:MAG: amidohydrolase family protein [Planctomycetes bacterium]|nr:amidohydrolase family protein [Planctomycetota bacterium]